MSHKYPQVNAPSDQLIACAHTAADAAAAESIRYFRLGTADLGLENKTVDGEKPGAQGSFDPVTLADRRAETAMRREIARHFPDHGIHGEEFPSQNPQAAQCWWLDPIDGTASFLTGWPLWGTLIGYSDNGSPQLGLIDQPFTRERFWAVGGKAMQRRSDGIESTLRTRSCSGLAEATITTTHPDYFATAEHKAAFSHVASLCRTTRYGGDCYAYAMLAAGHIDLIVESGLKAYDVAAHVPIIEAAGGRITTWSGASALNGGDIVAAGDARVHDAALTLLANVG